MKIILASQSPFRKHALDILGLKYEVMPASLDEFKIKHENPFVRAKLLAESKAKKVGETSSDAIVIAADLFVAQNNKIYEKPKTKQEASQMLASFSGKYLNIITGLAVYNSSTKNILSSADSCKIEFRELTTSEIIDYMSKAPVMKCAGAFEADGLLRFVKNISGSYNFMVGMPMDKLIEFLRKNEINV